MPRASDSQRPRVDLDTLGTDLRDVLRRIDAGLSDLAGGEGAPPGFDPRRFLAPGVPRVRPVLVLLSAAAAGEGGDGLPDTDVAEGAAAAAELLDFVIRLHDAALGRQGGRRRRMARRIISRTVGLLSANHVTLRALELVRSTPAPETVGDLLEALREVGEGHALMQQLRGAMPDPDDALLLAELRNGAVFAFACRAGARLAGAGRASSSALARYGRNTGIAWFLADELALLDSTHPDDLRVLEDRAATGAPGFVVALGATRDARVTAAWRSLGRTGGDPSELHTLLSECGAIADGRARMAEAVWAARQALHTLPPSPWRDDLDRIAQALAPSRTSA